MTNKLTFTDIRRGMRDVNNILGYKHYNAEDDVEVEIKEK